MYLCFIKDLELNKRQNRHNNQPNYFARTIYSTKTTGSFKKNKISPGIICDSILILMFVVHIYNYI